MQNVLDTAKGIGWIDGIILALILALLIRGFIRGASGELSSLISSCAMAALVAFGYQPLHRWVNATSFLSGYPQASGFITLILMGVAVIALWLLSRKLLAHSISLVIPNVFDHVLGGIFGGIKAVILIALLCAGGYFGTPENVQRQAADRSVFIEKLTPLLTKILKPD